MNYLFDTDTINFFYDDQKSPYFELVRNWVRGLSDNYILQVSILTIFELEYSLANAPIEKQEKIENTIHALKKSFEIVPLDESSAMVYGKLKSSYRKSSGKKAKDMVKHNIDLMIASTAIAENATLISADQLYPKLSRINPALYFENWTEE